MEPTKKILKINEARYIEPSKWTFYIVVLVFAILFGLIIGLLIMTKLFCSCSLFKIICCDKLGNRPIMTSDGENYSDRIDEFNADMGEDDVFVAERDAVIPQVNIKNDIV